MKYINKLATLAATAVIAGSISTPVVAENTVNVAFFPEWATPNLIAKVEKLYDTALGVPVNWVKFESGAQMSEAMLAGNIDIAYSHGLAPLINAVNAGAPIKLVAIAVQYPANECVVKTGSGINSSKASALEGKSVAVPLATMADYSFRMQMRTLNVDLSKIKIIDQTPVDAANSLAEGDVVMACGYGGDSMAKMKRSGKVLMTQEDKEKAGIVSFDVVSVTEAFAQKNPDMVRTFLKVTEEANTAFTKDPSKLRIIAKDAGMSETRSKNQLANFHFPNTAEQFERYFNEGGLAIKTINVIGSAFASKENPALKNYDVIIDTSFLN